MAKSSGQRKAVKDMDELTQDILDELDDADIRLAHLDRQKADAHQTLAGLHQKQSEILIRQARLRERYRSVCLRKRKGLLPLPETKTYPAPDPPATPKKKSRSKPPPSKNLISKCQDLLSNHPNGLTSNQIADSLGERRKSVSGTMSRGVPGRWVRNGTKYLLKKNLPT